MEEKLGSELGQMFTDFEGINDDVNCLNANLTLTPQRLFVALSIYLLFFSYANRQAVLKRLKMHMTG